MKKVISICLISALALSAFAGCSDTGSDSADGSSSNDSAASGDKTSIEIWVPYNTSGETGDWSAAIKEGFEATYPEYELDVVAIGLNSDDYNAKWQMAGAAKNVPDVISVNFGFLKDWAENGVIMDLKPHLSEEVTGRFTAGSIESTNAFVPEGTIFALPARTDAQGWIYNTTLFDQCDLEIPETFEDLMHCIDVFNENGITPMGGSSIDTWSIWGYHDFFPRYGLDYDMSKELAAGTLKFADCDAFRNGFERLAEMAEAGAFASDIATTSHSQVMAQFEAGQVAMYTTYSAITASMTEETLNSTVFNYGPSFEDGAYEELSGIRMYNWCLASGYHVAEDEAKLAAVTDFYDYFTSEAGTDILVELGDTSPTMTEDDIQEGLTTLETSIYEAFSADIIADPDLCQAWFDPSIKEPYRNAVTGVISGTLTVDEALEMLQGWADVQ